MLVKLQCLSQVVRPVCDGVPQQQSVRNAQCHSGGRQGMARDRCVADQHDASAGQAVRGDFEPVFDLLLDEKLIVCCGGIPEEYVLGPDGRKGAN